MRVQGEPDAATSPREVGWYALKLANVFSSFRQALPANSLMTIALVSTNDFSRYQT